MIPELKIPADTKYEWYVFENRIEVDLARGLKSRRKPDGVYLHPETFEPYRLTYGTISDIHSQSVKKEEEE